MRETFDVLRPRRIRDALIACGAARAEEFVAPPALDDADLRLVHTAEYLAHIRTPATLARLLFLDPAHPWDDRLLMPFLYAAGGTLAAALTAVAEGGIGLNLGGGTLSLTNVNLTGNVTSNGAGGGLYLGNGKVTNFSGLVASTN